VVGLRLGCLNHSLLTRDAIRQRGLRLAGWIVNRLDLLMLEQDANIAYLSEQLDAPLLADWPWDPAAEAASLALQLPA
jgi:dethiobiotin synthetase